MSIDEWITHWREKRAVLVAARQDWSKVLDTDPAAAERIADLDVRIAHHDKLIEGLLEKRKAAAA